jgi:transposase
MDKFEFTTTERNALHSWRFHHPHPRVQRTMEALSRKRPGLAPADLCRSCALSTATFYRSLHTCRDGGIARRKEGRFYWRQSPLAQYRTRLAADCRPRPPASVAEAAARLAALTGCKRGPTQVRRFLKSLGMQPRQGGQMPAKAAASAQEACTTGQLTPRRAEAKSGPRLVLFREAAPCVFAPFLGLGWGFERLFVQAPRGRPR